LITPEQQRAATYTAVRGDYYQFGKNTPGWCSQCGTYSNAWGYKGVKTAQDPCPEGFRIPSIAQFDSLFKSSGIGLCISGGDGSPSYATENKWYYTEPKTDGTWKTAGMNIGDHLFLPCTGGISNGGSSSSPSKINGYYNYSYANYWTNYYTEKLNTTITMGSSLLCIVNHSGALGASGVTDFHQAVTISCVVDE
jgi:uncharacterized protein (TIGR02145 family)